MISILGNHSRAAIELKFAEGFNILAYQGLVWSAKSLAPEHKRFLKKLEHTRMLWDRFLVFHGAPGNPDAYLSFLFQTKKACNYMCKKAPGLRFVFLCHTRSRAVGLSDVWVEFSRLVIARVDLLCVRYDIEQINSGFVVNL